MPKTYTMGAAIITGILTYTLPAIVIYFAVKLIMNGYLKNEESRREDQKKLELSGTMLPLKLQAMERLILLLERMSPAQAVNRALQPGMEASELQMTLLKNIREEYEHNIAQQLYISQASWALVKTAKEEITRVINLAASESGEKATGADFARTLLLAWADLQPDPIQLAISKIKLEIES